MNNPKYKILQQLNCSKERRVLKIQLLSNQKRYKMYEIKCQGKKQLKQYCQTNKEGQIQKILSLPADIPCSDETRNNIWSFFHSYELLRAHNLTDYVHEFDDIRVFGCSSKLFILMPWCEGKGIKELNLSLETARIQLIQASFEFLEAFHSKGLSVHDLTLLDEKSGNILFVSEEQSKEQKLSCRIIDIEAICSQNTSKKARFFYPSLFRDYDIPRGQYGQKIDNFLLLNLLFKEYSILKTSEFKELSLLQNQSLLCKFEDMISSLQQEETEKEEISSSEQMSTIQTAISKISISSDGLHHFLSYCTKAAIIGLGCFIFDQHNPIPIVQAYFKQAEERLFIENKGWNILRNHYNKEQLSLETHVDMRLLQDEIVDNELEDETEALALIQYWMGKYSCSLTEHMTRMTNTSSIISSSCEANKTKAFQLYAEDPDELATQLGYTLWGTAACLQEQDPLLCKEVEKVSRSLLEKDELEDWVYADVALSYSLQALWAKELSPNPLKAIFEDGCHSILQNNAPRYAFYENIHFATKRCLVIAPSLETWIDWAEIYAESQKQNNFQEAYIRSNLIISIPDIDCPAYYRSRENRKVDSKASYCSWVAESILNQEIAPFPSHLETSKWCLFDVFDWKEECEPKEDRFGWMETKELLEGKGYPEEI